MHARASNATAPSSPRNGEPCGACGSVESPCLVKKLLPGVTVFRCPECDVCAFDPMPSASEIAAHYEQYYLTRRSDPAARERLIVLHEPIVNWLLARLSGTAQKKALDYGFGSGEFLIQLSRLKQAAFGADLSHQNVRQLRDYCSRNGISISLIDLSESPIAALGDVDFDLITLFQVVEHMREPLAQLRRLSELQSNGGCIYIECPNESAILAWAKRFTRLTESRKKFWGSLKYPEHLHGFNRRSLQRMLAAAGYRVEACGDYHYRDGVHQVEAETWWPSFSDNPSLRSVYGLSRSAIPVVDKIASKLFRAGSGLFAFARKVG